MADDTNPWPTVHHRVLVNAKTGESVRLVDAITGETYDLRRDLLELVAEEGDEEASAKARRQLLILDMVDSVASGATVTLHTDPPPERPSAGRHHITWGSA